MTVIQRWNSEGGPAKTGDNRTAVIQSITVIQLTGDNWTFTAITVKNSKGHNKHHSSTGESWKKQ